MYARGTLLLAVYGDEKRYNIICVPSTYILYRYTQFNVILLSVAIENCPSVAHTHIYARILASDCEMVHISVNGRSYIYIMNRPSSRRRRTFSSRIRQTARKRHYHFATPATTQPSCHPPHDSRPNRPYLHHAHAKRKSEVRLSNYCHNLSWPFSEQYLGPLQFFFALILSDAAAAVSPLDPAAAGNNGREQMVVFGVYYTILPSIGVCASIYIYINIYVCVCMCVCTHKQCVYGGCTRVENIT